MKDLLHRGFGYTVDQLLCGALALLHRRHAQQVSSLDVVEKYFADCEQQTRAQFYALPPALQNFQRGAPNVIGWSSPAISVTKFPMNGRASVTLFPARPSAPTVIMLHALMSASDAGYRIWARRFNALGWNAAFMHLPFHYSRRPRGHLNGELCCTADLVLNGDTLRQGVVEVRQLMAWLREQGCAEFGLLGTSYGGWLAALVASLESDLRFLALLAPMVNVGHALFEGPTSWALRGQFSRAGIARQMLERHAHLSSPLHAPAADRAAQRTLIVGGTYDRIVRLSDLAALHAAWPGSELVTVSQAHFGYGMIPRAVAWLRERDLLSSPERK